MGLEGEPIAAAAAATIACSAACELALVWPKCCCNTDVGCCGGTAFGDSNGVATALEEAEEVLGSWEQLFCSCCCNKAGVGGVEGGGVGGDNNCCCCLKWGVCMMGGAAISCCKRLQVVLVALLEVKSLSGEAAGDVVAE